MILPKIAMIPAAYKANKIYSILPENGGADLSFNRAAGVQTRRTKDHRIESIGLNEPTLNVVDSCTHLLLETERMNSIANSVDFESWDSKNSAVENDVELSLDGEVNTARFSRALTGPELITNGTFDTDLSDWTSNMATTTWSSSYGGSASIKNLSGADPNARLGRVIYTANVPKNYILKYTVKENNDCISFRVFDGLNYNHIPYTVGTHEFQYTSAGSATLFAIRNNTSDSEIILDNISLKEDLPVTASYIYDSHGKADDEELFYSYSVFAKKDTARFLSLRLQGAGTNGADAVFDLKEGDVLHSISNGFTEEEAIIEDYKNGWYRCTLTAKTDDHTTLFHYVSCNNGGGYVLDGDSSTSSSVLVWGTQLELGEYSSSYIPTDGTFKIRRTHFTEKIPSDPSLIGQSEGVIFLDFEYLNSGLESTSSFSLGNTINNTDYITFYNQAGKMNARIGCMDGIIELGDPAAGSAVKNTRYKIALQYGSGKSSFFVNGERISAVPNPVDFEVGLTKIFFGNQAGAHRSQMKVYQLNIYNKGLSQSEVVQLTRHQ